jgi:cytochrome P450
MGDMTSGGDDTSDWNFFGEWSARQNQPRMPLADIYQQARTQCPIRRIRMPDGQFIWAVLTKADVDRVLMDTQTFSNAMTQFGPTPLIPIELDPPQHTHYRRILNRLINATVAERLAPAMRRYAQVLLEPLVREGRGDLRPVAEELALRVLCRLLGVDDSEWTLIRDTQAQRKPADATNTTESAIHDRFKALAPVIDYARDLIQRRKADPVDDLTSGLVQASLPDRPLTDDEVLQMLVLVLLGGHETTRSGLLSSIALLSEHPDVQDRLRADPSLIPAAVEECLRVEGPVQGLFRKVTREVELSGAALKAGEMVMPMFGAANLDPLAYECPERFDIDRKASKTLVFGRGAHLCVGAPIARTEICIFLEELLSRTKHFRITGPFTRERVPDLTFCALHVEMERVS